jgi:hypothetical protein
MNRNHKWDKEHPEYHRKLQQRRRKENPEWFSVMNHWHLILGNRSKNNPSYVGMPFCDEWNPKKGGSFVAGSDWIIKNLGKRPEGCSLHIVDHQKGFVPGNLEWASLKRQNAEQMFKIIANQRHRIKELEDEIIRLKNFIGLNAL